MGLTGNGVDDAHSCAITSSPAGGLKCWGYNGNGQVGDNNTTNPTPYPVNVSLVAAAGANAHVSTRAAVTHPLSTAGSHTCVIADSDTVTGEVLCWGYNNVGQLGDGTTTQRQLPVVVQKPGGASLTNAIAITTGADSGFNGVSCAVISDGTMRCWGYNGYGQLGNGTTTNSSQAQLVLAGRSRKVTDAALNGGSTTITSATAVFTSSDVGLPVTGNSRLVANTTIASVTNATTAVLSNAITAGSNLTGQTLNFGARGVTDGSITGGSNTMTSGSAAFTASDVGLTVAGPRIPDGTTITSVTNATTIVMSANATGSGNLTSQLTSFGPLATGVTDVSTGEHDSCAIISGSAWCWGLNDGNGETGDNATGTNRTAPVAVTDATGTVGTHLSSVTAISTGTATSCAVAGGVAYCWGWNSLGQIGDNTTTARPFPKAVGSPLPTSGITSISQGDQYGCAIATGAAYCWGSNDQGQLGDGTTTQRNAPVQVIAPLQASGSSVKLTGLSTAAVGSISAGSRSTCADIASGPTVCWGHGTNGELGDGYQVTTGAGSPVYVNGTGPSTWTSASVSDGQARDNHTDHSCVVTSTGGVKCWGYGSSGQMGNGTTNAANPSPVDAVLSAAAGASPVARVSTANGPTIASTQSHTCVIFDATGITGGLQCWGYGGQGQMGNNTTTATNSLPVIVLNTAGTAPLTGVVAVAAGGQDSAAVSTTCAILNTGGVLCWGTNNDGRVGDGTTTQRNLPTQVSGLTSGATSITVGSSYACAVVSGAGWCWGYNGNGQLGDNTTTSRSTPVQVHGVANSGFLSGLKAIAAGGWDHTCASTTGGAMYCWGWNNNGELGNNTTSGNNLTPIQVMGVGGVGTLANVVAIAAGERWDCAVLSSGGVDCWGLNSVGQLGDGTTTERHTPVAVVDMGEQSGSSSLLTGVSTNSWGTISAGSWTMCVQMASGATNCWGEETGNGELGHGPIANTNPTSTAASCTPTLVITGGTVTCTATVTDTASSGTFTPTGTVIFSTLATSATPSITGSPCTLSGSGATATCSVTITSAAAGTYTAAAIYGTQSAHVGSSGVSSTVTVTATKLGVTGPATCAYVSTAIANNAKAVYQLNEASGTTATDSTANALNGTITTPATYNNKPVPLSCDTQKVNGALGFDGTNTKVTLPTGVNSAATGNAFTVMTWFKATSFPGSTNSRLVSNSHTDVDHAGFQLMFNSGGGSGFFDVGNGSAEIKASWTQTLVAGNWYFYVGTYNGTTATAYLNGVSVGTGTGSGAITAGTGANIIVGAPTAGSGDKLTGQMADVAILPTVLSASTISTLYTPATQSFGTGTTLPAVRVQTLDSSGNATTVSGVSVTLSLNSGSFASGTTTGVTNSSGFVDFTDLVINNAFNGYTITATSTTATSGTSPAFNVVGVASQLVFTTQPVGGASGSLLSTQPVVKVEDVGGNVITSSSQAITLSIASGSGGTLTGCSAVTNLGVATFSGCTFSGVVGTSYTLGAAATSPTLTGTSNAFQVSGPGPATQLVFTTQPVAGVSGVQFTTQPTVKVEDAQGNVVTTSSQAVTLSIASGAGGTLTGCSATTTSGVAAFSGCTFSGTVGTNYTLGASATSPSITGTSASFQVAGPGAAAQLVFTVQPVAGASGSALTTQPTVTVKDAGGNVVTTSSQPITLSVASGSNGSIVSCSSTTTSGVAAFSGCVFSGLVGTNYTLGASATSPSISGTSNTFQVTGPGPAAQLVFTTQPGNGVTDVPLPTQPVVKIEDAGGNVITASSAPITLGLLVPAGTLSGCTSTTTNGVAAFSGCTISQGGGGTFNFTADGAGLPTATSASFTVSGIASRVQFNVQPVGNVNEAVAWSTQPTVVIADSFGNIVNSTLSITLSIASGPSSGLIAGCANNPKAATAGQAAFTGCQITGIAAAGTYTILAQAPGLTSATSNSIIITVGAETGLGFKVQPGGGASGAVWAQQPTVAVVDSFGNVLTNKNPSISLAIANGSGTLSGCSGSTNNGAAAFSGCKITQVNGGTFGLQATACDGTVILVCFGTSLQGNSLSFVVWGTATKVVFTAQPGGGASAAVWAAQPAVAVEDASGDIIPTDTSTVTLSINSGTGVLGCTANPKQATAGTVTFAGCQITGTAGAFTLKASDGALTVGISAGFNIVAGPATQLVFTVQPTDIVSGAAFSPQPKVAVEDAQNNIVLTDTSAITLAINTGQGGTLACIPNPFFAVAGVASFTSCSVTGPNGPYTLIATDGSLTAAISATFDVADPPGTTSATVTCAVNPVTTGTSTNCTITVTDTGTNGTVPAGTATWAASPTAPVITGGPCTLGSPSGTSSSCSVSVSSAFGGLFTISSTYVPTDGHLASSNSVQLRVTVVGDPTIYIPQPLDPITPGTTIDIYGAGCPSTNGYAGMYGQPQDAPTDYASNVFQVAVDAYGNFEFHRTITNLGVIGSVDRTFEAKFFCSSASTTTVHDSVMDWVSSTYVAHLIGNSTSSGKRPTATAATASGTATTTTPPDWFKADPDGLPSIDKVGIHGAEAAKLKTRVDAVVGSIAPVSRLYFAFFNRVGDHGGIDYWSKLVASGTPSTRISDLFATSAEFHKAYDGKDNTAFVTAVYQNVLHRAPDAGGKTYWLGRLAGGMTRARMVWEFANSKENVASTANVSYVVAAFQVLSTHSAPLAKVQLLANALDGGQPRVQVVENTACTLASASWWMKAIDAGGSPVV